MTRRRFIQSAALLGAAATTGCDSLFGGWGDKELEWRETVVLASGETVPIVRHLEYTVTGGIGGPRSATRWRHAILRSDSSTPEFPVWDAPLKAMLLERDFSGKYWIVATTESSRFWDSNGRPPFGYYGFVAKQARWVLAEVPKDYFGRFANLLVDIRDDDSSKRIQAEADARKRRSGGQATAEYYRQILEIRRPGYKSESRQPIIYTELKSFLE
jgi:hypothetical protein